MQAFPPALDPAVEYQRKSLAMLCKKHLSLNIRILGNMVRCSVIDPEGLGPSEGMVEPSFISYSLRATFFE